MDRPLPGNVKIYGADRDRGLKTPIARPVFTPAAGITDIGLRGSVTTTATNFRPVELSEVGQPDASFSLQKLKDVAATSAAAPP